MPQIITYYSDNMYMNYSENFLYIHTCHPNRMTHTNCYDSKCVCDLTLYTCVHVWHTANTHVYIVYSQQLHVCLAPDHT